MPLIVSLLFVIYGAFNEEPETIAMGSLVFFFLYPLLKFKKGGIRSVNPAFLYSLIKGMGALGNLVGLMNAENPEYKEIYFIYVAEDHLILAMLLHYFGSVITIFGFEKALKTNFKLPSLMYSLSHRQISTSLPIFVAVFFLLNYFKMIPSLGTLSSLIKFIPVAAIFFLARYGSHFNQSKFVRLAMILLIVTTLQAVLFSTLRMQMILPSVAFTLGMIIGKTSIKVLREPVLYPIYAGLFVFISYFTIIGEQRSQVGVGVERISQFQEAAEELEETEGEQKSTFLSRFSSMNQLSQIGRVVEEDGFYEGATLDYMLFGFIPRFIWPDKPIIQQGAWFAFRIGQGRVLNGKYTNSIDMTPAGELYLNFGWIGVIFGTYLLGFFFGSVWKSTNFWNSENNVLGSLLGFYLLYLGLFSFGADLQIVLTMTAMYLSCYAINKFVGKGQSSETPSTGNIK